jgi:hypothetical protein
MGCALRVTAPRRMLDTSARRMKNAALLLCVILAAQRCNAKLFRPFQAAAGRGLSSSSSRKEQVLHVREAPIKHCRHRAYVKHAAIVWLAMHCSTRSMQIISS